MTHRDRAGEPSGQRAGRREAAGDAGHCQGLPTPPPIRPLPVRLPDLYGSLSRTFGITFPTRLSRPWGRNRRSRRRREW